MLRERIDVSTSYQILAYRSKATTCLRCFWLVHPCTHQFNKQDRATVKAQFFSRVDHIMYQTLMRRTAWLRLERWFSLVEAVVRLRLAGTKCLSKSEKEEMVMRVRPGMRMFLSLSSLIGKSWELGDSRSSTWEKERWKQSAHLHAQLSQATFKAPSSRLIGPLSLSQYTYAEGESIYCPIPLR